MEGDFGQVNPQNVRHITCMTSANTSSLPQRFVSFFKRTSKFIYYIGVSIIEPRACSGFLAALLNA